MVSGRRKNKSAAVEINQAGGISCEAFGGQEKTLDSRTVIAFDFMTGDRQVFVPVSEEESFEQLDMLENAVMEVRDGRPGIVIKE